MLDYPIRLAIFAFVDVVDDGEVAVVTRPGDLTVFDGLNDGTVRFDGVRTV